MTFAGFLINDKASYLKCESHFFQELQKAKLEGDEDRISEFTETLEELRADFGGFAMDDWD